MRRLRPHLVLVLAGCAAVAVGGCGGGRDGGGADTAALGPQAAALAAAAPDAAALRTGLTTLLEDHVYGTAAAAGATLAAGPRSAVARASLAVLDENSVTLGHAIGGIYGPRAGARFLALWRQHNGYIAAYARARAAGDDAATRQAREQLDGYRARFGALMAAADPDLPQDAVAAGLKPQIAAQLQAIDAAGARTLGTAGAVAAAAETAPAVAQVIAGAVVKQFPDRFGGGVDSPQAQVASLLAAQLSSDVWLTQLAAGTGIRAGFDSGEFSGAAAATRTNTIALAQTVGHLYGPAAGRRFAALWHRRAPAIARYARAETMRDAGAAHRAGHELWTLRRGLRELLGGKAMAGAARATMRQGDDALLGTIRAQVAGSPKVAGRAAAAAAGVPALTTLILAGARPGA